jgi:hypothetical protein
MNNLVEEFVNGLKSYRYENRILTEAELLFFIEHQHQIAVDDKHYDHFVECFPNFFEYRNNIDPFVQWFRQEG